MMAAAFFMSVCSTADAVIARNFSAFVPTAGIIGFLIFGPMADLKNYLLMRAYFFILLCVSPHNDDFYCHGIY